MKEYLKQLYEQNGAKIFLAKEYNLFSKLLEKYPDEPTRSDVYCINAILGGNAFYEAVMNCMEKNDAGLNLTTYNIFIDQVYSKDRLWRGVNFDHTRFERILRMLFEVAGLDVSRLPAPAPDGTLKDEATGDSYESEEEQARAAYRSGNYKAALAKGIILFENGVSSMANLLGKAWFYGKGTRKDYNKALYYFSSPHKKTKDQDMEERILLEQLLKMRDQTLYSIIICLICSAVVFLFMVFSGFFTGHMVLALIYLFVLAAGSVLLLTMFKKKLIFDLSYWFLVLGGMFLSIIML